MNLSLSLWLATTLIASGILCVISASRLLWERRLVWCKVAVALLLAGAPFVFAAGLSGLVLGMLVTLQLWLFVLAARPLFGRLPAEFLRPSMRLNVALGAGVVVLAVGLWLAEARFGDWLYQLLLLLLLGGSVGLAGAFVYQALWTLRHFKLRTFDRQLTLKELPTVTLAIPARNETHALTECLQAAVASDYPKLEILVLDDCSQDKTSDLIRSFAHDGVRFVQGMLPAEGWLGRNQALATLAEHASGEYMVFAGVDTHMGPQSVRQLVSYALASEVDMVSVLPQRRDGAGLATFLWQLRYFWQIVLPVTKRRVPVATQAWLIRTEALRGLGGFAAVKHKIVAEGSFARRLFATDAYRFIIADPGLGITTAKRWSSQNETALRFLYPTFKRQPFFVLVGCWLLVGLGFLPLGLIVLLPLLGMYTLPWLLALLASGLFIASYLLVVVRTLPHAWLAAVIGLPFALVQELVLLVLSMLAYEFAEVNWKGRNVCYPVMTAYSSLPALPRRRRYRA